VQLTVVGGKAVHAAPPFAPAEATVH